MPLYDTNASEFLAFLEYLYTDHSPIEEGDSVAILMCANQYTKTRLVNLCELYITKEVDRMCCDKIERSDIDVIGLLQCAQVRTLNGIRYPHKRSSVERKQFIADKKSK